MIIYQKCPKCGFEAHISQFQRTRYGTFKCPKCANVFEIKM
jgi:predicted RNA-binding Zn-ribbon protein involved in translation (DUF1610 family)